MRGLLPLLFVGACACQRAPTMGSHDPGPDTLALFEADPWFRRPPPDVRARLDSAEKMPGTFVTAEWTPAALARLADSPFVEISAEDARSLLGAKPSPLGDGRRFVLLRCVAPQVGGETLHFADAVRVTWLDGTVCISTGAWRERYRAPEHRAVVAQLSAVPTGVYLDSATAIW